MVLGRIARFQQVTVLILRPHGFNGGKRKEIEGEKKGRDAMPCLDSCAQFQMDGLSQIWRLLQTLELDP